MINKQTLTLQSKEDTEIIGIQPASVSYIDEDFFREAFKEKQDDEDSRQAHKNLNKYLTYAVKVLCVRADWIINDDHGILFLKEMVRLKKNDIFMTNYVKIIT